MDSDPELDLTQISDDKIKQFLTCKLEQARLENQALEALIAERQQATTSTKVALGIQLVRHWTRIFNNKYCLGYELSCSEPTNLHLVLSEASGEKLLYKVKTFSASENGCNDTESCCNLISQFQGGKGEVFVVVCIEMPQFVQKLKYEIYANLLCNTDSFALPIIEIVQGSNASDLDQHCFEAFLTIIACSELSKLVLCVPHELSLTSTLKNNCSLTPVSLMNKTYYLAPNFRESPDNPMLIVHKSHENNAFIKVYTSDHNQLLAFLHHLLKTIPKSLVLPKNLYKNNTQSEGTLEQFKISMRVDLEQSYATLSKLRAGSNKLVTQREKLSKQEGETDVKYLGVLKM